jgi:hypothetical protein
MGGGGFGRGPWGCGAPRKRGAADRDEAKSVPPFLCEKMTIMPRRRHRGFFPVENTHDTLHPGQG